MIEIHDSDKNNGDSKKTLNWYPGHMAAAKRMMEENLKLVDVILEVRDARIPSASANPDIQSFQKPRLLLLNKADMADTQKTAHWLAYFKAQNQPALAITARQKQGEIFTAIDRLCAEKMAYFKARGVNKNPRVLVAGIPNAGKSTLINSLCGTARTKTGDKPGVTRGKQWIKARGIELLDTPGLLWPKLDDRQGAEYLAFTGALNDEVTDLSELALRLIDVLCAQYPEALPARYQIAGGQTPLETFEAICRRRGFLQKNGEADYERGARVLFDEFRGGKLGRITLEEPDA